MPAVHVVGVESLLFISTIFRFIDSIIVLSRSWSGWVVLWCLAYSSYSGGVMYLRALLLQSVRSTPVMVAKDILA